MSPEDPNKQPYQSQPEPIPQPQIQPLPQQSPVVTPPQVIAAPAPNAQPDAGQGFGIASLIVAFFIGIVGIILGIIGLNKSKKSGHKNGLAIAGIILGSIQTIAIIAMASLSIISYMNLTNSAKEANDRMNEQYQSYLDSQNSDDADVTDDSGNSYSDVAVLNTEIVDPVGNTGLALNYPDSWYVSNLSNSTGFEIASSDSDTEVTFEIYKPTGFSSDCEDDDIFTVYDYGQIDDYPDLGFVSSVTTLDSADGQIDRYYIGTYGKINEKANVGKETDINELGTFSCSDYDGIRWHSVDTVDGEDGGYVMIYISNPAVGANSAGLGSFIIPDSKDNGSTEIAALMFSNDYETAKRIIQSLHVAE